MAKKAKNKKVAKKTDKKKIVVQKIMLPETGVLQIVARQACIPSWCISSRAWRSSQYPRRRYPVAGGMISFSGNER